MSFSKSARFAERGHIDPGPVHYYLLRFLDTPGGLSRQNTTKTPQAPCAHVLPRLLRSKPESRRGALKKTELLASVLHWQDVVAPEVQIGKGAWGKVFAARFHKPTMKCALTCKRHDQNDCQGNDFFHEAEIMRKLRHPFVARVIFTSCSPVPAIAFELLGSSLEESTTMLNIPNAGLRDAFGCAMAGMSFLHSVQIAHRDICPRNMVHLKKDMKSKGWKLKLVDFDSSEHLDEQSRHGPGSLYFAPLIFGGWCRMALDRYALGMSFNRDY